MKAKTKCEKLSTFHDSVAQIISPPPPCFTVGISCQVLICCVCFLPNVVLCIIEKLFHSGLVPPKDIVPDVLWFVQIYHYKPVACSHFLCREKSLSPDNPSNQAILVSSFFQLYSRKLLTFNMLAIFDRVWDGALGLFCSFSYHLSDLGLNLLGHPLLGKLAACLNVF